VDVPQQQFSRECFVNEDSIATADTQGRIWQHTAVFHNSSRGLRLGRPQLQSRVIRAYKQPPEGCCVLMMFKRTLPNCLVVARRRPLSGLGIWLRFDFFDTTEGGIHNRWIVRFRRCRLASVLMHPDHDRVMVVVITQLTRRQFRAKKNDPVIFRPGELVTDDPTEADNYGERVTGRVAVYEVWFNGASLASATPRFYLSGLSTRHDLG